MSNGGKDAKMIFPTQQDIISTDKYLEYVLTCTTHKMIIIKCQFC